MAAGKPNKFLTPDVIAKRGLKLLHQQANFIGHITRGYDDRYAKRGAKIGNTLKIRLPNRFMPRNGATYAAQTIDERSVSLSITKQAGVDIDITSADLTTSLDDFSGRILKPAVTQVVAQMERNCLRMVDDVYSHVVGPGDNFLRHMLACGERLDCHLAPRDDRRLGLLAPVDGTRAVEGARGLYNPASGLSKQFKDGSLGKTAGLNFFVNTHIPQPSGPSDGNDKHAKAVNFIGRFDQIQAGDDADTSTVTLSNSADFKVGDLFTFPALPLVHPETKKRLYYPYQGRVTAVNKNGVTFTPKVVGASTGSRDANVADDQLPAKGGNAKYSINLFRVNARHAATQSVIFHPEAFCLATADLVKPEGVHSASVQRLDGISMRVLRMYDIQEDVFRCRLDVLYGYTVLRPELAVRLLGAEPIGLVA
ncbi:MAG: P22 phage major capsid protein family protein [Candidatus Thiodiazotropha endolucinida]